ncbi:carbohydrate binding family 9 domain-containing protein, partial [Caldithrix abyssi]|nr:carbohydrate binding family 9 domain-containing protein [Caldithrix abyssi]
MIKRISLLFFPVLLIASETTPPEFRATKVNQPIHIDGRLDEALWLSGDKATGFTQKRPNSGQPASQKTEVSIVYDDEFIYVGARMYDSNPNEIAAEMFRRDGKGYSDWFEIILDSYFDSRTAYGFQINPKGVLRDALYYNDNGNEDFTWNAVWSGAAAVDEKGWTAELKIPLSQLRYDGKGEEKTWGLQFFRYIARGGEDLFWSPILEETQGFVSAFGTLHGIKTSIQPKRLEILPYSAGKLLRQDGNTDDPYYQLNDPSANLGLDFKYGLGSNFTLTGTINPDFGQVEADPAVINLSAYETFFRERRPFFTEGVDIFKFGRGSSFYSRRIGRRPQGRITDPDAVFADYPKNSTILAAAKLSGKTSSGWSIGILDAITSEEKAHYTNSLGEEKTEPVEPQANNLVARVKKDFR